RDAGLGGEEERGAGGAGAAAEEVHARERIAAEGAPRGERLAELARERRRAVGQAEGAAREGAREDRIAADEDRDVARAVAELEDRDRAGDRRLFELGHHGGEVRERERAGADAPWL